MTRHALLLTVLMLVASTAALAQPAPPPASPPMNWQSHLDRLLIDTASKRCLFGGCVIELPTGRVVYERNSTTPLMPASNMKLIVIAAAIDQLGKGYQFQTTLGLSGKDLVIIGGGDPVLGDDRIAAARTQTITAVFHQWADKLVAAGVKRVPGDIVIDDSLFDQQFVHPNWPADQYETWYEAPVGALNFNSNCVNVEIARGKGKPEASLSPANTALRIDNKAVSGGKQSVVVKRDAKTDVLRLTGEVARGATMGPISVRDPGMFAGSVFKTVLAARGIPVTGEVVRRRVRQADGKLPADCHVIAVQKTPLADALARAGKDSLGMVAECLIKLLGSRGKEPGSWATGRAAVATFLKKTGVPAEQFKIDEGSGLSRDNRLTPVATARVLQYMFTAGNGSFELLKDSLATSGIDGTLDKRLRAPDTRGRIFAKTGYIKGVRTLAGYIQTQKGQWLAFAFFYNQANTSKMRQAQDAACTALVSFPDIKPAAPARVAGGTATKKAAKTAAPRKTGK